MSHDIWDVLGIAPTRDRDAIRRAYARKLRVTNPEDDAEGFMRLREAHDEAVARIGWDWMWEEDEGGEGDHDAQAGDPYAAAPTLAPVALATLERAPPASPTPLTPEAEELQARIERLELLLRGHEMAPATELEAAFHAVLNAEALEQIAVADEVETRISHLLLEAAPRSDALLAPAVDAFRWRRDDLHFEPSDVVQAIIQRRDFVERRDRLVRNDEQARAVVAVLQGPPTAKVSLWRRLNPRFEIVMKTLLERLGDGHEVLMAGFDAQTVAAWRQRYARPRLSSGMIWFTLGAPLLAPLIAGVAGLSPAAILAAYLATAAVILAAQLFYLQGYLRLKTAWEVHRSWRAGALERIGWAPLSLLLLPVSALLPDTLWSPLAVAGLGALLLAWTFTTTDPPSGLALPLHQRLLGQAVPFAWALTLPLFDVDVVTPSMLAALVVAAAVDFRGGAQTIQAWHLEMGRTPRLVGSLAFLAATIAAGVAAWRMVGETPPSWAPLCVASVLALAIGHRLPTAALGEALAKTRYYGMFVLFWLSRGLDAVVDSWLVTSTLWMLIGMAVGVILSLIIEVRDRTPAG
ncbi:J domain-containing protein [Caulobacter sp. CCNWLY153]|uniref:J domain-containing protein n=1 Tax=unclassified Caulobacter TaxID=2648921 RepID=UPI002FF1E4EC